LFREEKALDPQKTSQRFCLYVVPLFCETNGTDNAELLPKRFFIYEKVFASFKLKVGLGVIVIDCGVVLPPDELTLCELLPLPSFVVLNKEASNMGTFSLGG
jgi:hypothetical protein